MILVLRRMPAFAERIVSLWPLLLLGFVGLLGFTWLSDGVGDRDGATYVDAPVAAWFAHARTATEGSIGLLVAKATSPAVLILATAAVVVVLWIRGRKQAAVILGASVFVAYAAGALAKVMEHRARPAAPINLAPELEGSFPSGHVVVVSTIAFVGLGLAWIRLSRNARIAASVVAAVAVVVVALDRLVVGAHWLSDVAGSLFLASMIIAAALVINKLLTQASSPTAAAAKK